MNESSTNLSDEFDAVASRARERVAVGEGGRTWSYRDLLSRSQEITATLAGLCGGPGQRVGLMLPNSAAFVASFFGIARAGGVVCPLNVRYRSQELGYYLRDTGAVALLLAADAVERSTAALSELPDPPALVVVEAGGGHRVVRARRGTPDPRPSRGSPPLLHQYTSGSTGAPKRVVRTHANLLDELARLARVFSLSEADRFLGAAPFSHVNGLVRTMLASMYVGATLYPVGEFRRREVLDLIRHEQLTFFGGVPYMYAILAGTPKRDDVDLASLRIAFSASAPLLPADNRRFHDAYGIFVRQLYGSTETGTISVNLHPDAERHLQSVGPPLDGVELEILDDERRPLPRGQEGEVAIRTSAAITAYEGNREATASSFHHGFYLSGDLGRQDEAGYVTLTGRKKFLINRGGYKVNPLEVEEAIASHPKVREVVVAGLPGPHGDEIVRCVIVPESACTEGEILAHCKSRIADFKIPGRIEFRQALPRSETGKILRHEL